MNSRFTHRILLKKIESGPPLDPDDKVTSEEGGACKRVCAAKNTCAPVKLVLKPSLRSTTKTPTGPPIKIFMITALCYHCSYQETLTDVERIMCTKERNFCVATSKQTTERVNK